MNISLWSGRCIRISFGLLFLMVPLLLTPWNYELFEYNKMMAVYALTTIIIGSWGIKMLADKEIRIAKTPLDIPIALFLLAQLLSTIFSVDPHVSWFGYYSRWNGGMLSIISYILLYYAFVSNGRMEDGRSYLVSGKNQKNGPLNPKFQIQNTVIHLLKLLLLSGVLVSLYGMAEHFGIDKHLWVQDVQSRVFSTLGQPNWLAAYLVALAPIALAFTLTQIRHGYDLKTNTNAPNQHQSGIRFHSYISFSLYAGISALFFLVLLYTRSRSGFLGFAVADLVFWAFSLRSRPGLERRRFFPFILCHMSFVILLFLNGTHIDQIDRWLTLESWQTRLTKKTEGSKSQNNVSPQISGTLLETGGTESGTIRKYVWQGALTAWKSTPKNFLIGTGTETFAFTFFQYRPVEHNLTSEWDFLYNKAHNEYLNYLATTGILGLGSYLLLLGTFILWCFRLLYEKVSVRQNINLSMKNRSSLAILTPSDPATPFRFALFAGWLSILVTNFVGFSVVVMNLFLFLLPALVFCLDPTMRDSVRSIPLAFHTNTRRLFSGFLLVVILGMLFMYSKDWYADTLFANGFRYSRAGQYGTAYPFLTRALALNNNEPSYHDELAMTLAGLTAAAVEKQDATSAALLAKKSMEESDTALKISPKNVNFWKTRTKIYYTFSSFDKEFNAAAIKALEQAQILSPNDPKIMYNLAILEGRDGNNDLAINTLKKTIALKPDYRDAYNALWVFYQETKQYKEGRELLTAYLTKVDPGDKDFLEKLK